MFYDSHTNLSPLSPPVLSLLLPALLHPLPGLHPRLRFPRPRHRISQGRTVRRAGPVRPPPAHHRLMGHDPRGPAVLRRGQLRRLAREDPGLVLSGRLRRPEATLPGAAELADHLPRGLLRGDYAGAAQECGRFGWGQLGVGVRDGSGDRAGVLHAGDALRGVVGWWWWW
uniref:(northern house mosquito) hypothetical protein n=2 Tax=Culex pipiens TaxID=7175 RepID=A0A8D8C066_CULPI